MDLTHQWRLRLSVAAEVEERHISALGSAPEFLDGASQSALIGIPPSLDIGCSKAGNLQRLADLFHIVRWKARAPRVAGIISHEQDALAPLRLRIHV